VTLSNYYLYQISSVQAAKTLEAKQWQ